MNGHMKFQVAGSPYRFACGPWAFFAPRARRTGELPALTWSGVYTEEQAKRGESRLHQELLRVPSRGLAGDGFAPAAQGPGVHEQLERADGRRSVRAHPRLDAARAIPTRSLPRKRPTSSPTSSSRAASRPARPSCRPRPRRAQEPSSSKRPSPGSVSPRCAVAPRWPLRRLCASACLSDLRSPSLTTTNSFV